jgi:hypothetical protein
MHRRAGRDRLRFIALSDAGFAEFAVASPGAHLPDEPGQNFEADAMAIKEIEKTTSTTTSKLWSTGSSQSLKPNRATKRR